MHNYYNDFTFEFIDNEGLVLGGGGRYDKLAEILNIGNFKGVGVAFGIERIMNSINISKKTPKIYIIGANLEKVTKYCKILDKNEITYSKPPRLSKVNTQFKNAKRLNVKYVINTDEDTIKDLESNATVDFDIGVLIDN